MTTKNKNLRKPAPNGGETDDLPKSVPSPVNPPPDQPEQGYEIRVTPDRTSSQR